MKEIETIPRKVAIEARDPQDPARNDHDRNRTWGALVDAIPVLARSRPVPSSIFLLPPTFRLFIVGILPLGRVLPLLTIVA